MKKITAYEKQQLEEKGLIKYAKYEHGKIVQEPNIYVANKQHNSKDKTYYVVEEKRIMQELGYLPKPYLTKDKYNKKFGDK